MIRNKKERILRAATANVFFDRDVEKKTFRSTNVAVLNNIMRTAKNMLNPVERGLYSAYTEKELNLLEKLQDSLTNGRMVTIEGKKVNGDDILRKGTVRELKPNKENELIVLFNDSLNSGIRSLKFNNIKKVTTQKPRKFQQ